MKTGKIRYLLENLIRELSSDHTPIFLDVFFNTVCMYPPKSQYTTYKETFEKKMGNLSFPFPKITTKNQIDNLIIQLTSTIAEKLEKSSTIFSIQNRNNDLPKYIQNHIRKKRILRAVWKRTRDPVIKNALNKQISLVRDLLQTHRDNEWTTYLDSIDNNVQGWSKLYKHLQSICFKFKIAFFNLTLKIKPTCLHTQWKNSLKMLLIVITYIFCESLNIHHVYL